MRGGNKRSEYCKMVAIGEGLTDRPYKAGKGNTLTSIPRRPGTDITRQFDKPREQNAGNLEAFIASAQTIGNSAITGVSWALLCPKAWEIDHFFQ
jgi:hypothetical protein